MTLLEPDLRRTRLEHSHVFYQMTIVVGAEGADEVVRRHLGGSTLSAGDILGRKVDNAADGHRRYRVPLGPLPRCREEASPTSPSGSAATRVARRERFRVLLGPPMHPNTHSPRVGDPATIRSSLNEKVEWLFVSRTDTSAIEGAVR
jgi:hypothetical protein